MRNHIIYLFLCLFILSSCNTNESLPVKPNGIGDQIRSARESTGVSQQELANAVGLTNEHIKTIEKGFAVPTRDIIVEIEETLGVEIILDGNI